MNPTIKSLVLFILIAATIPLIAQNKHTLDSTILTSRVVKDSLDIPWEIIWGPDNHIWTTERFGRVSRINPESGKQHILLDMSSDVYERAEAGMLGMALHPDFPNTSHVFIAYTYLDRSSIKERLVKFEYDGTKLTPKDTLIENITGNTTHIGCRLIFMKDNTLLMTTGDAQKQALPQDTTSVVGKILRMHTDGSIPTDNPNPKSYIYSFGHRNAQGLWIGPKNILYSSEHGPTTDDELNIISPKGNYGWPNVTGFCDSPPENAFCAANNVVEPLAAWTPTIAPSDIIWYSHPAIPELKDKLLMTVLKDKSLIAFGFNSNGDQVTNQTKYLKGEFGRLRDICVSPSGKIYLATNGAQWNNSSPFTHSIIELSNESYTSLTNLEVLKKVYITPNPARTGESIHLQIQNNTSGLLTLFDVFGRVIHSQPISNNNQIKTNLKSGFYFWQINLLSGAYKRGKLIVN